MTFDAPVDASPLLERSSGNPRVLDLGCGYGRVSTQLRRHGIERVVGYDSAQAMIARGQVLNPGLDLRVGDAGLLPESDASFDAVVLSALFTCVCNAEQRARIVLQVRRVLRAGGLICGVDFLRRGDIDYSVDGSFVTANGIEMHHFEPCELEDLFRGFDGWQARCVITRSLSDRPSKVLQYTATTPA